MNDILARYEAARRRVDYLAQGERDVINASLDDVPKLRAALAVADARVDEVEKRNLDLYVELEMLKEEIEKQNR